MLWTPTGYRAVEQIAEGELVYARNENDPDGPIEAKVVEKKFQRTGRILHIHLAADKIIRTTPEHPFYVQDRGWTAAGELLVGSIVRTDAGWVAITDLLDTGEYEPVYNLQVAEWRTYFVGEGDWGWSLWAHNVCKEFYIDEDFVQGGFAVYEKQHGERFINPTTNQPIRGADRDALYNSLLAVPQGGVGRINLIHAPRDTTSWGRVLERYGSDPLGQTRNDHGTVVWPPSAASQHAHHVAMQASANGGQSWARLARQKLRSVGIDPIFGTENLFWAPDWQDHRTGADYPRWVYEQIQNKSTKAEMAEELKAIARLFIAHTYPGAT